MLCIEDFGVAWGRGYLCACMYVHYQGKYIETCVHLLHEMHLTKIKPS